MGYTQVEYSNNEFRFTAVFCNVVDWPQDVVIGETIYKEDYLFTANKEYLGLKIGSLDDIQKDITYQISEQVTQRVYDKAFEIAKNVVAFAKKDIARMKAEPRTQEEHRYSIKF